MDRAALDYAQPAHPAETAARHVPDYGSSGKPYPIWRILFLIGAAYLGINYLASRFVKPVAPAVVAPTTTGTAPPGARQP
jgi:hypothetical protein